MVARLLAAVEASGADMACAVTHGRPHPVFGLWPVALREALRRAMVSEEIRKVGAWPARYQLVEVASPDVETPAGPLDPVSHHNHTDASHAHVGDLVHRRIMKRTYRWSAILG